MPNHAQTCLNLSQGYFDCSEGGMATLKIIQNERLIELQDIKSAFSSHVT